MIRPIQLSRPMPSQPSERERLLDTIAAATGRRRRTERESDAKVADVVLRDMARRLSRLANDYTASVVIQEVHELIGGRQ